MSNQTCGLSNFGNKIFGATPVIAVLALLLAVGCLTAPVIRAQSFGLRSQGKPRPSFEVASVKPVDISKMPRGHEGHQLDRERYVDRTELLQYIVRAYLGGSSCVMTA